ncbi:MAG TPA: nuclear transport factor 2 family protein [Sphingomonas sp.]|nr:nuclear transport factor 2 family protein [Sphingomonas sp.]
MTEARNVEAVIRNLLRAAGEGDLATVEESLADDLVLFKVGHVRGRADLLGAVRDFTARGGSARYALSGVTTRVEGDLATVRFRSAAEIAIPGEPLRRPRWLESVELVRTDRWRISFYHSTEEASA